MGRKRKACAKEVEDSFRYFLTCEGILKLRSLMGGASFGLKLLLLQAQF